MHEMAIISDLLDICTKHAKEHNATKVSKIKVDIGRLSGVEVHYLKECFLAFREGIFSSCELECTLKDVVIECKLCGKQSILLQNEFKCHHCNCLEHKMISGDELLLTSLELE